VPTVRGPVLRLEPHADSAESEADLSVLCSRLRSENPGVILAADLFCGAGGLSLGLEQAGMRVVLGADHDAEALETHNHHMAGMGIDWDLGESSVVEHVAKIIRDNSIDVLAGGPPCQPFSKAGRSGLRHLVRQGLRDPHDSRRDLWRSYLEVVRLSRPRAVIMENVPDMALDREMFILRSIVYELESLGYTVEERVIDAWRYGVPQYRQRLILVAIRDGLRFEWPPEWPRKVKLSDAISDLPRVEGGWRPEEGAKGWLDYKAPRTKYQKTMRAEVPRSDAHKIFDHITRPVRADDLEAFELLGSETRYSDLPDHLKRYRDDIFDDKYKRLSGDKVSRTITAHIAKDGYWYIHPEQNRTLTIREAARIQTFPDWFRFAGPPSAAFRQIGNAVPPRLGIAIGSAVLDALTAESSTRPPSEQIGTTLAAWFSRDHFSSSPWFHSLSSWHILLGELLLDRVSSTIANSLWPLIARYETPQDLVDAKEELAEIMSWIDRNDRVDSTIAVAKLLADRKRITEDSLEDLVERRMIPRRVADIAQLTPTANGEEPVIVTTGALRVAARFHGNSLGRMNQKTNGRIDIARMVGYGANARVAQLGLLEVGADICKPGIPSCSECPLVSWCLTAPEYLALQPE